MATRYIDPTYAGGDSDGTQSKPWTGWSGFTNGIGDTNYFRKGTTLNLSSGINILNDSSTTLDWYGEAGDPDVKPIISMMRDISSETWTERDSSGTPTASTNLWTCDHTMTDDNHRLFYDKVGQVQTDSAANLATAQTGCYLDQTNNYVWVYSTSNPSTLGITIEVNYESGNGVIYCFNADTVTIKNLEIHGGHTHGIRHGVNNKALTGFTCYDCTFKYGGHNSRAIYYLGDAADTYKSNGIDIQRIYADMVYTPGEQRTDATEYGSNQTIQLAENVGSAAGTSTTGAGAIIKNIRAVDYLHGVVIIYNAAGKIRLREILIEDVYYSGTNRNWARGISVYGDNVEYVVTRNIIGYNSRANDKIGGQGNTAQNILLDTPLEGSLRVGSQSYGRGGQLGFPEVSTHEATTGCTIRNFTIANSENAPNYQFAADGSNTISNGVFYECCNNPQDSSIAQTTIHWTDFSDLTDIGNQTHDRIYVYNSTAACKVGYPITTDHQYFYVNDVNIQSVGTEDSGNTPVVTTSAAHGLDNGQMCVISGTNSTPVINGNRTITVTGTNTFTIDMTGTPVTVAGTASGKVEGIKSKANFTNIVEADPEIDATSYAPTSSSPLVGAGDVPGVGYDVYTRPKVGNGYHIGAVWPDISSSVRR